MKRKGYLFENIVEIENIKLAIKNASKKKKKRKNVVKILKDLDGYAFKLQEMLINGNYKTSPYAVSIIIDNSSGKKREIKKPKFYPDQCVQWAIMQVVVPVISKGFYIYSCGSIPRKGIHYSKNIVEKWIRKDIKNTKYVLQIDISKFYPSIDHGILKEMLKIKIKDEQTLMLLNEIIDTGGHGVPIGNYTSQWFANFYLTEFDYYLKQELKVKYYVRYMDDIVIFGSNKRKLHKNFRLIEMHLKTLKLNVKPNWQVYRLDFRPLDFLGFRFYRTHTTLRSRNALRIKRRAKKIYKKGKENFKDSSAMMSYMSWIKYSDSYNYYIRNIAPYININKMKGVIRNESKK